MIEKKDITDINDIRLLVDTFYGKIRQDELLGGIFNSIIQDRWPEHLEKMYRFWQTVLTFDHTYSGSPFAPHAKMPVEKIHFERWVKLFTETVDELFIGTNADEVKFRAEKMAEMFHYKVEFLKK